MEESTSSVERTSEEREALWMRDLAKIDPDTGLPLYRLYPLFADEARTESKVTDKLASNE